MEEDRRFNGNWLYMKAATQVYRSYEMGRTERTERTKGKTDKGIFTPDTVKRYTMEEERE